MAIAEFSWDASRNRFAFPGRALAGSKLSDQVLIGNARWFIIFRWAVIALLLLFQIFALIASDALTEIGITHQQGWPVAVTALLCIANILYIYALDFRPQTRYNSPSINIWAQIIVDLLCLSVVVHFVGSIATPAPFFYVLHIALSCIFFSTIESLIVTALVCAMYGIVLLIENPLLFLAPQSVSISPDGPTRVTRSKSIFFCGCLLLIYCFSSCGMSSRVSRLSCAPMNGIFWMLTSRSAGRKWRKTDMPC